MTGPQSSGPRNETLIGSGKVSASAISTSTSTPRNLPSTCSVGVVGEVSSSSSVPERRSSAQVRMVSVATRKISSTGIHWNSGRTSARLRSKKAAAQKKTNSVTPTNAARNSTAAGEAKKPVSSLPAIWVILRSTGHLATSAAGGRQAGIDVREHRLEGALLAQQPIEAKPRGVHGARHRRGGALLGGQRLLVALGTSVGRGQRREQLDAAHAGHG